MKAKTISKILRKKINKWADSIEDPDVRALAKMGTIVTGGVIASMLLKERVNDYDLYFRDYATVKALADYYVVKFLENPSPRFQNKDLAVYVESENDRVKIIVKSAGIVGVISGDDYAYFEQDPNPQQADAFIEQAMEVTEESEKGNYRPVFFSSNAITLSNDIQLVLRFYGEPDEIHKNYDFVHCTNYWTSWENKLTLRKDALEALLTRELRYTGSLYPLCSIFRTRKFIQRGWTINVGQYLKMVMQLQKLDLTDIEVLEDQLTGVDIAYFMQVLDLLKQKDPKKVSTAYLIEIIDRMF